MKKNQTNQTYNFRKEMRKSKYVEFLKAPCCPWIAIEHDSVKIAVEYGVQDPENKNKYIDEIIFIQLKLNDELRDILESMDVKFGELCGDVNYQYMNKAKNVCSYFYYKVKTKARVEIACKGELIPVKNIQIYCNSSACHGKELTIFGEYEGLDGKVHFRSLITLNLYKEMRKLKRLLAEAKEEA